MIRGNKLNTTANMAICAALLCSSSALFAQETVPVPAVQPTVAAPVSPPPVIQTVPEAAPPAATVAPPPAVRTVPDSQLGEPVASAPEPRAAAARPATRRAAVKPTPAARAVEAVPPATSSVEEASATDFAPTSDEMLPVDLAVEDTAVTAPVDQPAPTELADGTQDDWMIYGGLAAALGLAGLGGVIASRRRRARQSDYRPVEQTVPAPESGYPIVRPLMAERPAPRIIQPRVADQNLPPVTDPLFAERAALGPITDPLFFQTVAMPPVTDPMFADNVDYAGRSTEGEAFDKRRTWPAAPVRELEPAE